MKNQKNRTNLKSKTMTPVKKLVSRDENIMGGIPCVKGTRIPVQHIKSLDAAGVSPKNIRRLHYPDLYMWQIVGILNLG